MEQPRWPRLSDSVVESIVEYCHNERVYFGMLTIRILCEVGSKGCRLNLLNRQVGPNIGKGEAIYIALLL